MLLRLADYDDKGDLLVFKETDELLGDSVLGTVVIQILFLLLLLLLVFPNVLIFLKDGQVRWDLLNHDRSYDDELSRLGQHAPVIVDH